MRFQSIFFDGNSSDSCRRTAKLVRFHLFLPLARCGPHGWVEEESMNSCFHGQKKQKMHHGMRSFRSKRSNDVVCGRLSRVSPIPRVSKLPLNVWKRRIRMCCLYTPRSSPPSCYCSDFLALPEENERIQFGSHAFVILCMRGNTVDNMSSSAEIQNYACLIEIYLRMAQTTRLIL